MNCISQEYSRFARMSSEEGRAIWDMLHRWGRDDLKHPITPEDLVRLPMSIDYIMHGDGTFI
jgi:hypothetical protein